MHCALQLMQLLGLGVPAETVALADRLGGLLFGRCGVTSGASDAAMGSEYPDHAALGGRKVSDFDRLPRGIDRWTRV